jgi:hypothetical protein
MSTKMPRMARARIRTSIYKLRMLEEFLSIYKLRILSHFLNSLCAYFCAGEKILYIREVSVIRHIS